jgi:mannitol 2-dehydrogenase
VTEGISLFRVSEPSSRSVVSFPTYDRVALAPGIVHLGVGAFHRAHQGPYLDELAERRISDEWGVIGVGLRNARDRKELKAQDCRYAVLQRSADHDEVRVVGSLLDYLAAAEDRAAVLGVLADPRTKVVTLTVTGNGYGVDADGELDPEDDIVARDLAFPRWPRSVPGYLAEALKLRRDAGTPPFTVLSCDNMVRNGATARRATVAFARHCDEGLGDWIEENVAFPASVVDRITPEPDEEHRILLREKFGIHDAAPVMSERFAQWIVEDRFSNDRPPLEEVGVQFVPDATPYELAKKRLLNGSHSAIGYVGYLCGYRRIDEALTDPMLRRYLKALMDEEVTPLLPQTVALDLAAYKRTLLTRFANPRIGDQLQRLCGRGSTKMPAYLLPSLQEALERGLPHRGLTLAVAAWFRYLSGVDFEGRRIEVNDQMASELQPLARQAAEDPRPLLAMRSVFGDLGEDDAFVAELRQTLRALNSRGAEAAVEACLTPKMAAAA